MMSNSRPFLDVEDDDQRQSRIGTLLERLNTTSSSSSVSPNSLLSIDCERLPGPIEPPSGRTTHHSSPVTQSTSPSAVLARVKAFLPAISASNEALSQQRPEDIDIENVAKDEGQYIEMKLGLGVFDIKPFPKPGPRPASPSSEAGSEATSDATSSESDSHSESSRSSSEEDSDYSSASANDDSDTESQPELPVNVKPVVMRPLKPLPRAKIGV